MAIPRLHADSPFLKNDIVQNGRCLPSEVFTNSKNMEHYAWVSTAPSAMKRRA